MGFRVGGEHETTCALTLIRLGFGADYYSTMRVLNQAEGIGQMHSHCISGLVLLGCCLARTTPFDDLSEIQTMLPGATAVLRHPLPVHYRSVNF